MARFLSPALSSRPPSPHRLHRLDGPANAVLGWNAQLPQQPRHRRSLLAQLGHRRMDHRLTLRAQRHYTVNTNLGLQHTDRVQRAAYRFEQLQLVGVKHQLTS
jgi:hypothetical protein